MRLDRPTLKGYSLTIISEVLEGVMRFEGGLRLATWGLPYLSCNEGHNDRQGPVSYS